MNKALELLQRELASINRDLREARTELYRAEQIIKGLERDQAALTQPYIKAVKASGEFNEH